MSWRLLAMIPLLLSWASPARAQYPLSWGEMQEELRLREDGVQPPRRVPYGPLPEQFGELSLPAGDGPFPLAVVVHGGCWQSIADLSYLRPLARELVSAGWAVWSLEFRRIDQEGAQWPTILEDVAAGTDHARALAEEYPLDLSRLATVGHSSGGHLALWLAGRPSLPPDSVTGALLRGDDPLPVAGAVGLAAIADLVDYRQYTACGPNVVEEFLGVTPGVPVWEERLQLADPVRSSTRSQRILVMGELDPIVPPEHARAARDRASGGAIEVVEVTGAGHFELVAPWTEGWAGAWARVRGFLDRIQTR